MKRNIILIAIVGSLFLFGYCSKDDNPPPQKEVPTPDNPDKPTPDDPDTPTTGGDDNITINISHYILSFAQPENFKANVEDDLFIKIGYFGNNVIEYYDYEHEQDEQNHPDEARAYKELCERYNDVAYNRERTINYMWGPSYYSYLIYNFVAIDVTSTTDYDAQHPAGTSLSDICQLVSMSPRDYIESGYKDGYDWSVWPEYFPQKKEYDGFYGPADKPFCIPLAECTAQDMILMGEGTSNIFMLRFIKKPDAGNKLQRFTITMTDETGKTYTVQTDVCEWE